MPAVRVLLAACLATLLLAAASADTSPAGEISDPPGDQSINGPLWALRATPLACQDPVFDAVHASVRLVDDRLEARVTMRDLQGFPSCGPAIWPAMERTGVVHVYTESWGYDGHYVALYHTEKGAGECAYVYAVDPFQAGCAPMEGRVEGQTIVLSIPREGTFDANGVPRPYVIREPFTFYGKTYTDTVYGTIEDTYGWR